MAASSFVGRSGEPRRGRSTGSATPWWRRLGSTRWLHEHPYAADALLALVLVGLAFASGSNSDHYAYRGHDAFSITLIALAIGPIVVRRRFPVTLFVLTVVSALVLTAVGYNANATSFAALVAIYTVAAHRPRKVSRWALVALVPVIIAILTLDKSNEHVTVAQVGGNAVIFGTAWILGDNIRTRRKYIVALEDRAERLEHERGEQARQAVVAERARIARELHDVVAHHVGVMVVQAAAARRVLDRQPEQAQAALETIEATGREAMTEMRAMLDVLRDDDEAAERRPQPVADDIESLVGQVRDTGIHANLTIAGTARSLPSGVDLSLYRIVQESLTNVMKHAGPNAAVHVELRYSDHDVEVEVIDNGRGAAVAHNGHDGHGLVGMRERAALYGGTLRAGPRTGGGYRVSAAFPLEART